MQYINRDLDTKLSWNDIKMIKLQKKSYYQIFLNHENLCLNFFLADLQKKTAIKAIFVDVAKS